MNNEIKIDKNLQRKLKLSDDCVDFVNRCLIRDPEQRIGFNDANEIYNHNWFKDVNWNLFVNMNIDSPMVKYIKFVLRKYSENYCHNKYFVKTEYNYLENDLNEKNLVKRMEHFGKEIKQIKIVKNEKEQNLSSNSSFALNLNPIHQNSLLYIMVNYHQQKFRVDGSNESKLMTDNIFKMNEKNNLNELEKERFQNKDLLDKNNCVENQDIDECDNFTFIYNKKENSDCKIQGNNFHKNKNKILHKNNTSISNNLSEESLIPNKNGLKRHMREKLSELIKIQINEMFKNFYYNKYSTYLKRKDDFINFAKTIKLNDKNSFLNNSNNKNTNTTADTCITVNKKKFNL